MLYMYILLMPCIFHNSIEYIYIYSIVYIYTLLHVYYMIYIYIKFAVHIWTIRVLQPPCQDGHGRGVDDGFRVEISGLRVSGQNITCSWLGIREYNPYMS